MNDPNEHIQNSPAFSVPGSGNSASSTSHEEPQLSRTQGLGLRIGFVVGLPLGVLSAGVSCWIVDDGDYWQVLMYGAVLGTSCGGTIGYLERKLRGDIARADVATHIGVLFGILPAVLILCVAPIYVSRFFIGLLFAGPFAGMLIGAMFDRANELMEKKEFVPALGFALVGLAVCIGGVYLIEMYAGPDPSEVTEEVRNQVLEHFRSEPNLRKATVNNIDLVRKEYRTFAGVMGVSVDQRIITYDVEAKFHRGNVTATWTIRK